MDASRLTSRSVEVINAASTLATNESNPAVEPIHLALALVRQEQGIATSLLSRAGAEVSEVERALGQALASLPHAAGSTVSTPSASAALTRVLAKALDLIKEMGDDYVATEHLLLALVLLDTPVRPLLAGLGIEEPNLREAITAVRGNRRVTSPRPRRPTRRWRSTPSTSPHAPRRASSTRSSAATPRSAASCRCCRGAPRTTRC